MINQAVHTLDLLYYLGGTIRSVRAGTCQLLDYGIEVEDTVSARLYYENGAVGLFTASNANYGNTPVEIAVRMEKAEFMIRGSALYRIESNGKQTEILQDEQRAGEKFYYGNSHQKLIHQFYRALETDGDYIHVKDSLMSLKLIDAIQNASRFGTRMDV